MKNHLIYALNHMPDTQKDVAKRCKITPSTISRLRGGLRPTEDTLKKLCSSWIEPGTGRKLLIAHLFDEMQRAGHQPHDYVLKEKATRGSTKKKRILDTLTTAMDQDAELLDLLKGIATMIDKGHAARQIIPKRRAKK